MERKEEAKEGRKKEAASLTSQFAMPKPGRGGRRTQLRPDSMLVL
jgi:hypothetical protein